MAGVSVAYYLVHSMASGDGYRERDLTAARAFGRAAAAGVAASSTSAAWGSRGRPLAHTCARARRPAGAARRGVPVTEFRAAVVVGAGSVSFEIAALPHGASSDHDLPALGVHQRSADRRRRTSSDYLVAALDAPPRRPVIEVGGRRRADLPRDDARLRPRARPAPPAAKPVPVLTPALSSHWVHLVTPSTRR